MNKKQREQLKIELEKEKNIEQRKSFVLYSTLYEILAKHNYENIASTIDQLTKKDNSELCEMYKDYQNIKAENKKLKEENKKLCAGNTFYDYVKELQIDNRQKEQQLQDLQNVKLVELCKIIENYYEDLDSLAKRLQLDYAGDKAFEQTEEDRLALCGILDAFDEIKGDLKQ